MRHPLRPLVVFLLAMAMGAATPMAQHHKKAARSQGQDKQAAPPADLEALSREVDDHMAASADNRESGISPMEIQEVKGLLDRDFPRTAQGADLKVKVYVVLSRIYYAQGISPMAIKVLQDGIQDLSRFPRAEVALREELVDIYRALGFAPQAIREHRRIRALRASLPAEL